MNALLKIELKDATGPVLWTPYDASGGGNALSVVADGCSAFKLGYIVVAFYDFQCPNPMTGSYTGLIGGLPFQAKAGTNPVGGSAIAASNATPNANCWAVVPSSKTMKFFINGSAQNNAALSNVLARGCVIYAADE